MVVRSKGVWTYVLRGNESEVEKKVRLRRRQVLTTCRKIAEDWDFFTPPDNHHIFFNVYINLEPLSYENRLLGCKNTNLFAYKGIFWGFSSKKSHNLTVIQRC